MTNPITDRVVVILKQAEIMQDMPNNGLDIAAIANLLQGGVIVDGDYYAIVPKDQWFNELEAKSNKNAIKS